jgi:molecular chaperone GrpE (heat shock protein)
MGTPVKIADEFASAMQELSAQASQSLTDAEFCETGDAEISGQLAEIMDEFRTLTSRIDKLEKNVSVRLEEIATAKPAAEPFDFVRQFQKLDEQFAAIRNSESVNKRLFDSLHEELIGYRDNFLHESLQKPFIRDLIVLFDHLSSVSGQLANAEAVAAVTRPRENLDNAVHSLVEVLHRLEVKEVEPVEFVDRAIHKVVSFEPSEFQEDDGRIVMRLKRGFLWRDRLLRAEEVIAKRFE